MVWVTKSCPRRLITIGLTNEIDAQCVYSLTWRTTSGGGRATDVQAANYASFGRSTVTALSAKTVSVLAITLVA